jgi:hypothetical protein
VLLQILLKILLFALVAHKAVEHPIKDNEALEIFLTLCSFC